MSPEDFWYLPLKDFGDEKTKKKPLGRWGSWDDDFEENRNILTWEETQEHDHDNWAIMGYRGHEHLVVIDFDFHKHEEFGIEPVNWPGGEISDKLGLPDPRDTLLVRSRKQDKPVDGMHVYCLVHMEDDISDNHDELPIDILGDITHKNVNSPFHGNDKYEIINDPTGTNAFTDIAALNRTVTWDGKGVVQKKGTGINARSYDPEREAPDSLPYCYKRGLEQRAAIPRDGSYEGNPWKLDSAVGRLAVAHGYDIDTVIEHMREYAPKDGFNEKVTRGQLEKLYQKQLAAESEQTLRKLGVLKTGESCNDPNCQIDYHGKSENDIDISTLLPVDEQGNPVIHEQPLETADPDEPLSIQSVARGGKTYTLTQLAVQNIIDKRVVYIAPTHDEARETYKKFTENHGVDAVWLCGERYAREHFDVKTDGQPASGVTIRNPEQAGRYTEFNAYATLVQSAQQAQYVVTVPELMENVGEYDMLLSSEESALRRMTTGTSRLLEVQRTFGNRAEMHPDINNMAYHLERLMDQIEKQEALHAHHKAIRDAVNTLLNINHKVENWRPNTWNDVDRDWNKLLKDVNSELDAYEIQWDFEISKVKNYLKSFQSIQNLIINMIYADGTFTYSNKSGRNQLFLCSKPGTVITPVPEDVTVWLAGFAKHELDFYHTILQPDIEPPEPYAYMPKTPVIEETEFVISTSGKNPDQQTGIIRKALGRIQTLAPHLSIFTVEGSSDKAAANAQTTKRSWTPSPPDDKSDLMAASDAGMQVCCAVTSRFSKGIDTPFFQIGAMSHGKFATPMEDYISEKTGDLAPKISTVCEATQNALLRASNTFSDGTDQTPVLTGDRQIPDLLVKVLEAYGAALEYFDEIDDAIMKIIEVADQSHYEEIQSQENELKEFDTLLDDLGEEKETTA